ncbi:MAG: hypothetical protein ACK4SF_06245 [Algoriphagus aquaeductus]|uniref:hypothetical protein n=1 Tax=Algoriphagus aquaeductus TaxID=475299 RepID=UPI0038791A96
MRLNTGKNIDKEVHLPAALEFRQEKVWAKIEKKNSKRTFLPWLLVTMTGVAACLLLILWIPKTKEIQINDRILVTGLTRVPADPKLDLSRLMPAKQEDPLLEAEVSPKENIVSAVELPVNENPNALAVVAESSANLPIEPIKSIKSEENVATKPLSPAALLLKKSLTNTKNEMIADQILIQEKFNLKNELTLLGLDKSSGNATGSVFESLKKNSYAKN